VSDIACPQQLGGLNKNRANMFFTADGSYLLVNSSKDSMRALGQRRRALQYNLWTYSNWLAVVSLLLLRGPSLMPSKDILSLLRGGDRRTIGHSDQVAAIVSRKPGLFPKLIAGLWSSDPIVRMRAADAAEKVTRKSRELLRPCKKELLGLLIETKEQELRWHLAVMIPRLILNANERQIAAAALKGFLADRSAIVKTFALQGLTDLAVDDADTRRGVIEVLRKATRKGTPAMRARSRKLLFHLERLTL